MKSQFQALLTQRPVWRITAVWLAGLFLLAIGLSACGGQANSKSSAPPIIPEGAGDGTNVQAVPVADQTITGFGIDGWF